MEENAVGGNDVIAKKRWLFSVTPLSKYLAMALFVLLPIVGFFLGMKYQKAISIADAKQVLPSPSGKMTVSVTPSPEVFPCGEIPSGLQIKRDNFTIVKGPMWSTDCKNIAWSSWQSTFDNPEIPVGLFLYDTETGKYERVYSPDKGEDGGETESVELQKWEDNGRIVFVKDGQKVLYIYDLTTKKTSLFEEMKQRDQKKIDTIIGGGCKQYFDGCNSCTGNSCTLMFCENYEEPRCLD